jgi:hypothetical protein
MIVWIHMERLIYNITQPPSSLKHFQC